ncbi:hypothetical protein QIG75_27630, partial [Klebsiella pneumoniae]|nr:hypothetical protein [Klebsiella pneumoniae]
LSSTSFPLYNTSRSHYSTSTKRFKPAIPRDSAIRDLFGSYFDIIWILLLDLAGGYVDNSREQFFYIAYNLQTWLFSH